MKPIFKQYENGLRLVFKKVESTRPASLYIAVDAGSYKETEKNNGISHFIEHLTFKGTENRTAKQISTELEEIGANANAYTSKYTTCYFATCLSEKMENCFDILSDIVFCSKYAQKDIDKERQVIFEEIDMYDDDPESVAYEQFCKDFYAGSPLERPIIGTKEILEGITKKDIEEYVKENYIPQNIVVSVVGNFTLAYVEKLVKKYSGKRFTKKAEVVEKNKSMVIIPDKKFSFIKKDIAQTHIVLGFPCDNIFTDKKMAYTLFGFIFGAGMGSRLFQKVREENGLVYSISCVPELFECGGDMVISLGTNKKNQLKAMELIKQEIDKLVKDGFTEEELTRAKTFCKTLIVSGTETGSSMAKSNANNILTFNRIISVEERLQKVESVTVEELNELAVRVFNYGNVCGCVVSKDPDENIFNAFN
ncbi:MAG: insulinase family protein [Clostridia bacterium]|nr:insulinase family protein [Clostridia bacterium]